MKRFKTIGAALIVLITLTAVLAACKNSANGSSPAGNSGGGSAPQYVKVPYDKLEDYLANTASSGSVNYIEVTGNIPAADFKGNHPNPGALGLKLKNNSAKKAALKIETYPVGLTDMTLCFDGCTSLIQAPVIPQGVTDMTGCFSGCTNLTQVPVIPQGVTDMTLCFDSCTSLQTVMLKCNYNVGSFDSAFKDCTALVNGGIKVLSSQLQTYKNNAAGMGTQKEKFAASN